MFGCYNIRCTGPVAAGGDDDAQNYHDAAVTEGKPEPHREGAFPFLDQFTRHVINRSDVVCVHSVPEPEGEREGGCERHRAQQIMVSKGQLSSIVNDNMRSRLWLVRGN